MKNKLMQIVDKKRQPMEVEVYDFLTEEGINFLPYHYATSVEELKEILDDLENDNSYVMKVMSPRILHKSDFNAVKLNIKKDELIETFEKLEDDFSGLDFQGVLIVPMAGPGVEFIIGSTTDPTFGVITIFGIGGTMVEIINDVTFGKAPLSMGDARLMIKSIESQKMLQGPRGLPKVDHIDMAELLVKISEISITYKDLIREIDLNPVRATAQGIYPLDARVIFHPDTC